MNRISGKRILITGATSGIGRACAHAFAAQGARLILVGRREDRLEALRMELTAGGTEVHVRRIDVRERDEVLAFGRDLEADDLVPDVLVNNAGLASGLGKVHEGDFDDWDRMIQTNVVGLLNVTRAILPAMVRRDSGHVVNIGSIAGRMVYPGGNVYNATKFAVRAINEAMNVDLMGTSLRVSSVDPGAVDTEFSEVRFHGDTERARTVYEGFEPLHAEDVADAVLYVVNAPPHVNVQELLIMPTAQRNPYLLHKE